jgi:uncharacterized protein
MLTGKLVPVRKSKDGSVTLVRIEGKKEIRAIEIADAISTRLRTFLGCPRGELDEALRSIEIAPNERILRDGLTKLFLDDCEFTESPKQDAKALRQAVFLSAGAARREGRFDRNSVLTEHQLRNPDLNTNPERDPKQTPAPEPDLLARLYADLPTQALLLRAPLWCSDRNSFAQRYNDAIEQGLLASAESVTFTFKDAAILTLASFLRKLKFHGLLCAIVRNGCTTQLSVSGASSVFGATTRYGMSFAMVLPHLKSIASFDLDAVIRGPRAVRYLWRSTHVSEAPASTELAPELAELQTRFKKRASPWTLSPSTDLLVYQGGDVAVPELLATHSDGNKVFLEFLGPWSRSKVFDRLSRSRTEAPRTSSGQSAKVLLCAPSKARLKDGGETGSPAALPQQLYVYSRAISVDELEKRLDAVYM